MCYETLQYAVIYLLPTRENNLKVNKMTVKKKTLIVGLSFQLRTPLIEYQDFVLEAQRKLKSLVRGHRTPPSASRCVVIIFFRFFTKDFYFDIKVIIYCVLFTINITFYRSFISSVLHIWFLFSLLGLALAIFFISYFSAIMEFQIHGGQIKKIYHSLSY